MARNCSVCTRPDAAMLNDELRAGRSARSVALAFGLSDDAVGRHARHHLHRVAPPVRVARREVAADPLDELVVALRERALAGSDAASREYRLALQAQSAARHAAAPTRDLAAEPEWIALRTSMLDALEPFPKARLAIVAALEAP
jgi:hypothetical protein